ncbi:uncharacterized protein J3D65DRAFT_409128 [Phyllosticta citribraziliensis]|uniref:MARVEL domain-containing protein n=1 Tax=Phyllosticta citribraziliensis TaxID=989973 RepID=A0ABR1LNV7_9PEZI
MAPRPHSVPRTPSTPGPLPSFPAAAETRYTPAHQHRRNASATSFSSTSTAVTMTEERMQKPDLELGPGVGGSSPAQAHNTAEPHLLWKVALRTCSNIVSAVGFVTLVWAASNARRHHGHDWLDNSSIGVAAIPFAFSLVFNTVVLTAASLHLRRRVSSPLHPFVSITADLLLWMSLVIVALIAYLAALDVAYVTGETTTTPPGDNSNSAADSSAADRHAQQHVRQPLYYVSGSLACAATALHFALFVWGCVDARQCRSSSSARPASSSGSTYSHASYDEAAFAEERARQLVGEMVRTGRLRVVRRGSGPDGVEVEGGEGEGMEPLLAAVERGLLRAGVVRPHHQGVESGVQTALVAHEQGTENAKGEVEVRDEEEPMEKAKEDKVRWT